MTIAIYGNRHQPAKYLGDIQELLRALRRAGVEVIFESRFLSYLLGQGVDVPQGVDAGVAEAPQGVDMVMSVGGDGTFLRAATWVADREIPILGVNSGHLGYLSAVSVDNAIEMVDRILRGDFSVEERALIMVESDHADAMGIWPYALNEVAVLKEDTASMITAETTLNGEPLARYLADGLIVATPTGSTGYNLSVGGPIVEPTAPNWVLTPVAAHSLTMRPLVVSDTSVVTVTTSSRADHYRLSLDGRSVSMPVGSQLTLRRAPFPIRVVQPLGHTFTDTLRQKLLWGASTINDI